MNNPKVTVAIAAYNVGGYIAECIDSALHQDFDDLEILVCNDCSTDNTLSVVEKMAKDKSSRGILRVITHPVNLGVAAVRNTCIDTALGEYICFVDGDDYLAPNTISTLYSKMTETHADIVMGNFQRFYTKGSEKVFSSPPSMKANTIHDDFAVVAWMNENHTTEFPISLWNKLFSCEWLKKYHVRCKNAHHRIEDVYFTLQCALYCHSITTIEQVTYFWRMRDGSGMHATIDRTTYDEISTIYDDCYSLLECSKQGQPEKRIPNEVYAVFMLKLQVYLALRVLDSNMLSYKKKMAHLVRISTLASLPEVQQSIDCINYPSSKFFYRVFKLGRWCYPSLFLYSMVRRYVNRRRNK